MIRFRLCFRIAVFAVISLPFIQCYLPCGGDVEKTWLEQTREHLIQQKLLCRDPVVQARLQYTIDRYDHICPHSVRFQPCIGIAHNIPWVPGISIDPEALKYGPSVGAQILYHEAQHDYFPWFGHAHFR